MKISNNIDPAEYLRQNGQKQSMMWNSHIPGKITSHSDLCFNICMNVTDNIPNLFRILLQKDIVAHVLSYFAFRTVWSMFL